MQEITIKGWVDDRRRLDDIFYWDGEYLVKGATIFDIFKREERLKPIEIIVRFPDKGE